MGAHGLAHKSTEIGSAKGTGKAGTLLTVSTAANTSIEDIAAATQGPKWFQLYLHDDRGMSRELCNAPRLLTTPPSCSPLMPSRRVRRIKPFDWDILSPYSTYGECGNLTVQEQSQLG